MRVGVARRRCSAGRWWPPAGGRAACRAGAGPSRTRRLDVEAVVHQLEEEVLRAEDVAELAARLRRPSRSGRCRSQVCTSPDGQPVVAMMPLPYCVRAARGPCGACRSSPRGWPASCSRNRLRRPVGVGAPASSCGCRRRRRRRRSRRRRPSAPGSGRAGRCSGVTYASMPMIGLTPGGGGLLVEVVGAEHVAVVGHRQRRHAQPVGLGEQLLRAGPRRRASSTRCARAGARTSHPRARTSPRGTALCEPQSARSAATAPACELRLRPTRTPGPPSNRAGPHLFGWRCPMRMKKIEPCSSSPGDTLVKNAACPLAGRSRRPGCRPGDGLPVAVATPSGNRR